MVRLVSTHFGGFGAAIGAFLLFVHVCHGALVWETRTIARSVPAGEGQVVACFRFRNAGTANVTIRSVQPSCGCIAVRLAKNIYAPGEAGELKATFAPGGRVGPQEQVISVFTDDAPAKPVILTLWVNIQQPVTILPVMLVWRIGEATEEKRIEISAAAGETISSIEIAPEAQRLVTKVTVDVPGKQFNLWLKPPSTAQIATIASHGEVKFEGRTPFAFTVYALIR